MKNKYFLYIISFSWIMMLSCNDEYLERYPLDSPSDDTFLTNEAELEMAVTGVYNALWYSFSGTPFSLVLDYTSDIGWDRNTNDMQVLALGVGNADNTFVSDVWKHFYAGISRCNNILDKAEGLRDVVPEQKYNQLIAETRFFRAYYYYYLNELYGGVPLVTNMLTLEESQTPRSTKEQVTDFILAELDLAVPYLLDETFSKDKGRVNKAAALTLKSRVALYNERWDDASSAAKQVMDMGTYSLHNDFGQLFSYAGESSKEIIMSVQYEQGVQVHAIANQFFSRLAKGFSGKIPVQSMVDSYECIDGKSIDKSELFDPERPFENRDPRLTQSIVLPQTRFIGYMFETHPDSVTTWNFNTTPASRVSNTDVTNAYATFSGYLWRKYADIADKDAPAQSDIDIILFRYAEVLLNYAEAKIEANEIDQSVYEAINLVRQRPSVEMPPITAGKTQQELRSAIRKERKYELAAEGFRLFDIKRWKIAHQVMPGKLRGRIRGELLSQAPAIDENGTPNYDKVSNQAKMRVIETRTYDQSRDYLWPIPRLEMEVNTSLQQNPNY